MGQKRGREGGPNRREAGGDPQERKTTAPRVVIDTNVILNAVFRNDRWAQEVLAGVRRGGVDAIFSTPMIDELSMTFSLVAEEAGMKPAEMVKPLFHLINLALASERCIPTVRVDYCLDDGDNKFVESALTGRAAYIITMNTQDFLDVPDRTERIHGWRVEVVSPFQFIQREGLGRKKGVPVRLP